MTFAVLEVAVILMVIVAVIVVFVMTAVAELREVLLDTKSKGATEYYVLPYTWSTVKILCYSGAPNPFILYPYYNYLLHNNPPTLVNPFLLSFKKTASELSIIDKKRQTWDWFGWNRSLEIRPGWVDKTGGNIRQKYKCETTVQNLIVNVLHINEILMKWVK